MKAGNSAVNVRLLTRHLPEASVEEDEADEADEADDDDEDDEDALGVVTVTSTVVVAGSDETLAVDRAARCCTFGCGCGWGGAAAASSFCHANTSCAR